MMACVDVDYRGDDAVAACVLFRSWSDESNSGEHVRHIRGVQAYVPGQFYKRELPCLLAVLGEVSEPLDLVVVDGYVWLADESRPGLGAHLHQALGIPVVGVAKTRFASAKLAVSVVRGENSTKPLFVTAVGLEAEVAAQHVRSMHGPHRLPTLLRRVDQLCRNTTIPG
jgi:deoxyribonuclease V